MRGRAGFEDMRKRLEYKIVGYDNQSRVGYKIFNCAESDHKPANWRAGLQRYRPTCGPTARIGGGV